jgi:hypothetical protein
MQEMFYSELQMTLECRDTKLLPLFWVHPNVSTLKGRANKGNKWILATYQDASILQPSSVFFILTKFRQKMKFKIFLN